MKEISTTTTTFGWVIRHTQGKTIKWLSKRGNITSVLEKIRIYYNEETAKEAFKMQSECWPIENLSIDKISNTTTTVAHFKPVVTVKPISITSYVIIIYGKTQKYLNSENRPTNELNNARRWSNLSEAKASLQTLEYAYKETLKIATIQTNLVQEQHE